MRKTAITGLCLIAFLIFSPIVFAGEQPLVEGMNRFFEADGAGVKTKGGVSHVAIGSSLREPLDLLSSNKIKMWLLDGQAIDSATIYDGKGLYDATVSGSDYDGRSSIPKDTSYTDLVGGVGSFESGTLDSPLATAGFDGGETSEISTVQVKSGTYSWHLSVDGGYEGIRADNITIVVGDRYRMSCWIFVVGGAVNITVNNENYFKGMNVRCRAVTETMGRWEYLEVTARAQGSSSSCDILIMSTSAGAAEFYVDDLKVEHLDSPSVTFADNDFLALLDRQIQSQNLIFNGALIASTYLIDTETPVSGDCWNGTDWTFDGTNNRCTHATGNTNKLSTTHGCKATGEALVKVQFTMSNCTAGNITVTCGYPGRSFGPYSSNGDHIFYVLWERQLHGTLYFTPTSDFDGSIGPVSSKQCYPGLLIEDDGTPRKLFWEDIERFPSTGRVVSASGSSNKQNIIISTPLTDDEMEKLARKTGRIKDYDFTTNTPLQTAVKITNNGGDNARFSFSLNGNLLYNNVAEIVDDIRAMPDAYTGEPDYQKAWRFVMANRFYSKETASIDWSFWPTMAVNSLGWSRCGGYAKVLANIWIAMGYSTQIYNLAGDNHCVSQVYVTDHYEMYDASVGVFYYKSGGTTVASVADLVGDTTLISAPNNPIRPSDSYAYSASLVTLYGGSTDITGVKKMQWDVPADIILPPGGYVIVGGKFGDLEDLDDTDCPIYINAKVVMPAVNGFRLNFPAYVQSVTGSTGIVKIENKLEGETYDIGGAALATAIDTSHDEIWSDLLITATAGTEILYVLNPMRFTTKRKNSLKLFGDVESLSVSTVALDAANYMSRPVYENANKVRDILYP